MLAGRWKLFIDGTYIELMQRTNDAEEVSISSPFVARPTRVARCHAIISAELTMER